MELDERLRWIEIRVTSSLKPRAEELKWLFSNKENREIMFEFCNNEEKRYLLVYSSNVTGEGLVASFKAPSYLAEKAMFFVKTHLANKLSRDNIADDVGFCDCSKKPLKQLKRLVKDVYLPMLSIEHGGSVSADKLMDLLHRIVANLHVFDGNVENKVALPLPSIEVLSEAAAFSGRRPAVIHVLETTVVQWIKQIKVALKLDPGMEMTKHGGPYPGPLTEVEMWSAHLDKLNFLNEQLRSPVAVNILMNLEDAHSTYGQSFHLVKKELAKAEAQCHENLQYLSTLLPWFQKLHAAGTPYLMLKIFPPLMHTLYLVWMYSRYYHEKKHFYRLLCMLSNEVVERAKSLVNHNVLDKLDESFQSLKDALRVCASFRGCYLDKKDKADDLNHKNLSVITGSRYYDIDIKGELHPKIKFVLFERILKITDVEQSEFGKQAKIFGERNRNIRQTPSAALCRLDSVDMWTDSPWPPRNHQVFSALNGFMERCNDVLELVQTTTHFKMLQLAADIGGAGGTNLNSLVEEIYDHFEEAIQNIRKFNLDVLEVDESHQFEKAFFAFRSVMRNLERRLADVLRQSFKQCSDTAAKLRLLEVFEGTSGRELVQENLCDICDVMIVDFTRKLLNVLKHFEHRLKDPPEHAHLPPVASKLMWLKGLKARIREPMSKFRKLSVSSFKGDKGWKLRETYNDLVKDIEKAEVQTTTQWQNAIQEDLRTKLKQPLLIQVPNGDEITDSTVQVNLDPDLLSLLKEVFYLADPPFSVKLPDPARFLLRSIDDTLLRTTATRLETIVSRYNLINNTIQPNESPLFERKLMKINELLEQGLHQYSWKTIESADFVEHLCSLVCEDVHKNLCVVQNNYKEITNIVAAWSESSSIDEFSCREKSRSYSIDELDAEHREMYNVTEHSIVTGGHRIHGLLLSSFEAVQISRASPAWQNYIQCISKLVLEGLQNSVVMSLNGMAKQISSVSQEANDLTPVLTIRLELSGSQVVFNPKLDEYDAAPSVQEYVERWIEDFLKRGDMVKPLEPGIKTYRSLITGADEVQNLITTIKCIVKDNAIECQKLLGKFRQYAFLWMQDVERTFKEFLAGNIVAHPRDMSGAEMVRSKASISSHKSRMEKRTGSTRTSPASYSLDNSGALGLSEKTFLNPKRNSSVNDVETVNVPSLDDFDKEIEIFRKSRDEICKLSDWSDIGCTRVNMCPIKEVMQTYSSKWMFTYTKYLSDQVSSILNDLDSFLKRIEPGVEAITGKERDITSFMRLMGIFNEVNTQQAEMDSKFVAMKRSILLLEKYDQKLPETTQKFYAAAPQKWNNLKLKVAQAKQRLGPRIQSEEKSVTTELEAFGKQCDLLVREFLASEAFNRKCLIYSAFNLMELYQRRMEILANQAQDLIELQELLEKNVVNFSVLPQLESDLDCLRKVWNMFRDVQEQQNGWRRQRWLNLDTKLFQVALDNQLEIINSLPLRSNSWDVHSGMLDSIVDLQMCLPMVEDLKKAALRPRHWKQLIRLAGENVHVTSADGLVKMSLGQLIELGLHQYGEEVRSIIHKATKDVAIESSLKTYEEVWLSKVFELKPHKKARASSAAIVTGTQEVAGSEIDSEAQGQAGHRGLSGRFSVTSYGSGGLSHKESKTRRTTPSLNSETFSLSLTNLTQDSGPLCLLTNCDPLFDELESHQVSLQSMLCATAASSFTDDILKWQKQLQTVEAVLTVWLEVQDKWVELEDIFASFEIRIALPHEANLFAAVNRDFRLLMKATERNTNVLQNCARTNIKVKLEKMQMNLQQCWKSLLALLERRQQKFPRFYFLSTEDVLHLVCNGHHPTLVNPYLSKVYENIDVLQYTDDVVDNQSAYKITGVVSTMEERLDLPEPILCDSSIENWLSNVEKSIKSVLNGQLKNVLNGFGETIGQSLNSLNDHEKTWMIENTSEVVLLVTHIDINTNIKNCLGETGENLKNSLKVLLGKITMAIASSSRILKQIGSEVPVVSENECLDKESVKRSGLSTRGTANQASRDETQSLNYIEGSVRQKTFVDGGTPLVKDGNTGTVGYSLYYAQKLVNLIGLLIHKKDFVRGLLDKVRQGDSLLSKSFEWSSQVKYEYSKEDYSLSVNILDATLPYGMEYQGACPRLVLTPLTDKCFVSLAQAVKCHMVGMCVGPSAYGKSSTVHEFARVCGRPFYPFTCSTTMDQVFLTGVFKGLALTGAWVCFSHINVMEKSVLSVVTQLVKAVMDSLNANKPSVMIESEEVTLISSAACFGTINSTVTAKEFVKHSFDFFPCMPSTLSELPRGLVERLRAVSFVRPDTRVIAEVCLLANGFTTAAKLSEAIVKLQNLCETFIPSFNNPSRCVQEIPSCMPKGSGWSTMCIKRIINDAANNLDEKNKTAIHDPSTEFSEINDHEALEKESRTSGKHTPNKQDKIQRLEENALVEAIRDTFLSGLSHSDAVIFVTLTVDVFEDNNVPMIFGVQNGVQDGRLALNDPVSNIEQIPRKANLSVPDSSEKVLEVEPSVIAVATARLGLQPGAAFQCRVAHLAQLVFSHKTVAVVGPSGCGKTECIKTVAAAYNEIGRILRRDVVCTGALQSRELMGYFDSNTREWKDGLLPRILRKHAQQLSASEMFSGVRPDQFTKWIHLDGIIDEVQAEMFDTMIQNSGTVVFPSGERIRIPPALEIIWEMENLEHVSPATICQIGLLCMNTNDVGWSLVVDRWISKKAESEAELLRSLCNRYIGPTLDFLSAKSSVPPQPGAPPTKTRSQALEHAVFASELNMVETLIALVEASVSSYPDLMPVEYENYFNFSAIWAFGGTLIEKHRIYFSQWWKKQWKDFIMLPGNGEVWNYFVSPETNEFCLWSEALHPYAMPHGEGIPHNAYVHTVYNESLSHLVGLLSDAGRPVILVGEQGCGKTSAIRDKLTNQDGDVAEMQSTNVFCNQFTTSQTLWHQINSCLEWKHGRTYVPKGNKKLICLVDDLNLSKGNSNDIQSASELIRELIDHGGVFDPETYQWREVQDVTFLTTYNPHTSATVPKIGKRLLRHFSLLHVPYPSVDALHVVYSCLLNTHFLATKQVTSGGSLTQVLIEGSTGASQHIFDDESDIDLPFRELLSTIVLTTIELQSELRIMYLPTAQRCHYIFTMADLTMVFRNLCLSLRQGCSVRDLLLLWRHECDWVYNRRLVDYVDRERYLQTFVNAVKKEFVSSEQIQIVLSEDVLFTSLVEAEDTGMIGTGESTTGGNEENVQLAYRQLLEIEKVRTVFSHGIAEYNKDFPKIKLVLYKDTIELICRLVRVLQSPHECSHAMIVSEGSPGATSSIVKLAAHLCGFSLYQINSSSMTGSVYSIANFRTDLVTAYHRAGVKREKLLLLLGECDIVSEDMVVYISEFLVSSSIAHLFSEEERISAINSVRSDVTQAGLTYTKDVAWSFFLKTVRENLRIVLTVSSPGSQFQRRCREFPGLTNNISIMFIPHWSKEDLVSCASHLLQGMDLFDLVKKENMAHLFASMHLTLRQQETSEDASGSYGHITNTTFEKFVERFNILFKKKYASIRVEYERLAMTSENIHKVTQMAGQRIQQLQHERVVLEQKKESNLQLLSQIGQDKAIAEEQIKLVQKQKEKISQLQKALPKFREAQERAVFKAAAAVSDIRYLLRTLDSKALAELRAMQRPDPEFEDILAAVIIIVKSPTSDLTWNKGAKRIMANLDRFYDELAAFDELNVPESTLQILDPYLMKPYFDPVYMNNKTNNSAIVILVKWVSGVARYHRMMLSKVKPLHTKVEETSKTVSDASGELSVLNNKLKDLDTRLSSLAQAYEEACIDKCRQKELTETLNLQLERAGYFDKVISKGHNKWEMFLKSISSREAAIAGTVSLASAFATYLGPYNHKFRRDMLSVHWPECLHERGVPLLLESTHKPTLEYAVGGMRKKESNDDDDEDDPVIIPEPQTTEQVEVHFDQDATNAGGDEENDTPETTKAKAPDNVNEKDLKDDELKDDALPDDALPDDASPDDDFPKAGKNPSTNPEPAEILPKYDAYVLLLMKNLVGDHQIREWVNMGMGIRLMENAIINLSSWQRPSFCIDPHGRGLDLIRKMENSERLVEIDVGDRDLSSVMSIEKAITSGSVLVLHNVNESVDSIFLPLIYRINTNLTDDVGDDSQSVICGGRRLMCHPNFKLYLLTSSHSMKFTPEIASVTSLVNFTLEDENFEEEILSRSFSRVQPQLWNENKKTMKALMQSLLVLEDLDNTLVAKLCSSQGTDIWNDTEFIADIVHCRSQVIKRLEKALNNLDKLGQHKEKYKPLSHLVSVIFKAITSLAGIQHEYRFSVQHFLALFELALSKVIPSEKLSTQPDESKREEENAALDRDVTIQVLDEHGNTIQPKLNNDGGPDAQPCSQKISIILPPEVELPTPDSFEAISNEVIVQLIDEVTRTVFQSVFRSIYSDHRLAFGTLLSTMIQKETSDDGTFDKQMELLISGGLNGTHHLSLVDFDPTLLAPTWIPPNRWQSLLSLSTIPGPLEGLCAKVAAEPKWQEWYNYELAETLDFPGLDHNPTQDNPNDDQEIEEPDMDDGLTELHGLLIVRCLRPDRLPAAIKNYVVDILDNLNTQMHLSLSEILQQIEHSMPIMVLLANNSFLELSTDSPSKVILELAEKENIPCQHLIVASGHETATDVALATAVRTDSWIIIENIHFASVPWLKQLYIRLARLRTQAEASQSSGQWRVFITTKPTRLLPEPLLYLSYPLTWDSVQMETSTKTDVGSFDLSLNVDLLSAITSSLNKISKQLWEEVKQGSLFVRTTIFRFCIFHGILCTRQKFGARAMIKEYPFDIYDLEHSIKLVLQLSVNQGVNDTAAIMRLSYSVIELVYGGKMTEEQDNEYRRCLIRQVFNQQQESSLTIEQMTFPLPPINVDPSEYAQWLKEKLQDTFVEEQVSSAVRPDLSTEIERNESIAFSIAKDLGVLLSGPSQIDTGYPSSFGYENINIAGVRRNMEVCLERLPTLLKLETSKLCPSGILLPKVLSQLRALSLASETNSVASGDDRLSESMGYALLQEYEWFNAVLCHVRQSLYTLEERVLRGPHAIPPSMNKIVILLQHGLVPDSWLHVNWQPSAHSLYSWLDEFQKCHNQLEKWLQNGYVPNPQHESILCRGRLDRIWLGGLVNPAAILTSLKHEKAISCGWATEHVTLECYVGSTASSSFEEDQGDSIILTGLYIEGGLWEVNDGLISSSFPLSKMSDVFVKAVCVEDDSQEPKNIYHCPVYRNRSRQYCCFELPLKCSDSAEKLLLKGVALIIDPGEIEGSWKLQSHTMMYASNK